MTKEEAIKRLIDESCKSRLYCELYPDACQKEECEIYMAIEALQRTSNALPTHECVKQTHECVDLISRQAVLDLWKDYQSFIATKACEYDTKLRELPSEPVGNSDTLEWIPCSVNLPKEDGIYLCTFEDGIVTTSSWHKDTKYNNGFDRWLNGINMMDGEDHIVYPYRVVAWMPLPKPWKGADDEADKSQSE